MSPEVARSGHQVLYLLCRGLIGIAIFSENVK
jgi:hypothetical protein